MRADSTARLEHAVDVTEQRRIVEMLEHVLAHDFDELPVAERQR